MNLRKNMMARVRVQRIDQMAASAGLPEIGGGLYNAPKQNSRLPGKHRECVA